MLLLPPPPPPPPMPVGGVACCPPSNASIPLAGASASVPGCPAPMRASAGPQHRSATAVSGGKVLGDASRLQEY
uniref:Uncharacterized protein n=1 Tax=Oryza punctata TaxID=4537 RepID=A0A0E0JYU5_ORYPU